MIYSDSLYKNVVSVFPSKDEHKLNGLTGYPLSCYISLLLKQTKNNLWVIFPSEESLNSIYSNYNSYLMPKEDVENLVRFPSQSRLITAEPPDFTKTYSSFLNKFTRLSHSAVFLTLRNFLTLQPVFKPNEEYFYTQGKKININSLSELLISSGFVNVKRVGGPGEFALKGEIIDIFPPDRKYPIRLSLDWDIIDSIREFDTITQTSVSNLNGVYFDCLSKSDGVDFISSYFRNGDQFLFVNTFAIESSHKRLISEAENAILNTNKNIDELLFDYKNLLNASFIYEIEDVKITNESDDSSKINNTQNKTQKDSKNFLFESLKKYYGDFNLFANDCIELLKNNWTVYISSPGEYHSERLRIMLENKDSVFVNSRDKNLFYLNDTLSEGFVIKDKKILVILDSEIFLKKKKSFSEKSTYSTEVLQSFTQLNKGDYVVHINYGIGRFVEIEHIKLEDAERDYIRIEYKDKEFLSVPIEQTDLIQKYIGTNENPSLDTLGSKKWSLKKEKSKKNAELLARSLRLLYAKRKIQQGFACKRDDEWQFMFESGFEYDETEDQISAIRDVKGDMESPSIMDRLVCGDVGFGKTEVAFRAAFKAIMNAKQVVFLSPTTVLNAQHFKNFSQRVKSFPIRVSQLSRLQSQKEQKKIVEELKSGKVDIVFGTHRAIQKDVSFKNLGLLIIDEEQRFGVKDKEKIKTLKENVDTLTLSATPIPRTLYMSLLKIRDMSLLKTPPQMRKPVQTFIMEFSQSAILSACQRELNRGGQVYYLHNRVADIDSVVSFLCNLLPGVKIEAAHGQMTPEELEDIFFRFINGGIQILVSTTIIENGLDIPNANTIIVDNATIYGAPQLYQLRGRVGRSAKEAYAYLLYPNGKVVTEEAVKRLKIIAEATSLGSGFKVASKDMQLRGAGNILGKEQSGLMEEVGLEMYLKMVDESIRELESGVKNEDIEVYLSLNWSGFIPNTYISDDGDKFDIYKSIAILRSIDDADTLKSSIKDRYGELPKEVVDLFLTAEIKIEASKLSIRAIEEKGNEIKFQLTKISLIDPNKVIKMMSMEDSRVFLFPQHPDCIYLKSGDILPKDKPKFVLEFLKSLL